MAYCVTIVSKGVETVNKKELAIIRKTAEGINEALQQLHSTDMEKHLINALVDMTNHLDKPLSSKLAGYYAMMLLASQDLQ